MPRPYVSALSEAQNHYCCYCNLEMVTVTVPNRCTVPPNLLTRDHYIPRCYGGPDHVDNLVAACGQCNWVRGTLDAETFYLIIQQWFRKDPALRERWHTLSKQEFSARRRECARIDRIKWQRGIKRCPGARQLNVLVPMPLPPYQMRA